MRINMRRTDRKDEREVQATYNLEDMEFKSSLYDELSNDTFNSIGWMHLKNNWQLLAVFRMQFKGSFKIIY